MAGMNQKDILDSLDDLGYDSPVKDIGALSKAIEGGLSSPEFTQLISWLSGELKQLCNFEEQIHPMTGAEDEGAFLMEVSSFIREMNCPYPSLTDGPISLRLSTAAARTELLNYLITELQAARMTVGLKKDQTPNAVSSRAQIAESSTATHLKSACIALNLPKPPETITSQQLFSKLVGKAKERLSKVPKDSFGNPLFIGGLSLKQWQHVDRLNENMKLDYRTRAELLIQRLDVTIQSFTWSDRVKKQEDQLLQVYRPLRQSLKTTSNVTVAELLAARDDLTRVEKTANSNLRAGTVTALNKLLIKNKPPDRGGRPSEVQAPPPEMPSWQKRTPGRGGGHFGGPPQQQRVGGGGGGGRGSGRVQGGGWQGDRGGGRGGGRQDNHNTGYQQQQHGGQYQHQHSQQQYGDGSYQHQQSYQQPQHYQPSYQHQQSYQQQGYQHGGGYNHPQDQYQHQQSYPGSYQGGGGHHQGVGYNHPQDQYHGGGGRGHQQNRGGGRGGRGGRGQW